MKGPVLIVGAGISGAVLARSLAESGFRCVVLEERRHVAGNCHTSRDAATGIMVHRYGPHIFHTDDEAVWRFVGRFAEFVAYRHKAFTVSGGRVFSLPINLLTINQFFGQSFTPEEAAAFIRSRAVPIASPRSFEEQALATMGPELYRAFFRGYTQKQWGRDPGELPAAILKRLPVRFDYDNNYFHHTRQALPRHGYTALVENMLRHPNIEVRLGQGFAPEAAGAFGHVFYTGPLDRYFGYCLGRLSYRTLDFEELRGPRALQGTAVMNYADASVPWTRITEHSHLAPWEKGSGQDAISFREYSRECLQDDIPYYPVHLSGEQKLLTDYVELADLQPGVTFLGRLGCYAYLDMDAAIARALEVARHAVEAWRRGKRLSSFIHRPA
ncbi:UDP-galactopyranose mutase [Aestuariivirga sp.]|uniref:UDP-galactopyranose mutase n=1 Tax=Aestuariivirga sp. TaxID=2650926 RepID=UPI0039196670